ncbi:MAG: primosomal protein N', partial [Defluviitaleaceae bacterium]|nr:primosomal protein N' [Defluviitaleaceae bacterium]
LSYAERFDQWKNAKEGKVSVMIGPRSAIFAPFSNLGIIIIDEEHETSYKSDTTPKFDAREIAVKLSELTGATLVMGSATPSMESYFKTQNNEYNLITLEKRVNGSFPDVKIVDMRKELLNGNKSIFSEELFSAIKENIENDKQTILFLNRRGYSTFVSCRKCGCVMECEDCNINYTYHIYNDKLICHYCNKRLKNPENCPQCGSKYIKYFGVGTQKIEDEVRALFPNVEVLRMDMDTTQKKHAHENILEKFRRKEAQILIGTQMIAKGLDFPDVTLVGVVAADISLNSSDYKSGEQTFQLLTQVSGRAGRADYKGKVFIQTYNPEHYAVLYSKDNDYDNFFEHEIALRRQMNYPPYSHIFSVLFTCENEKKTIQSLFRLKEIFDHFNKNNDFEILGPSPAIISKIRRRYRWKIIVKSNDETRLKNYVLYCVEKLKSLDDVSDININLTLNPLNSV